MEYITYLFPKKNYQFLNIINIYNCIYNILNLFKDDIEKQKEIIQIIRINIGNQFCDGFKDYLFHKLKSNDYIFSLL